MKDKLINYYIHDLFHYLGYTEIELFTLTYLFFKILTKK